MRAAVAPIVRSRLNRTIRDLSDEYRGVLAAETVARYVEDSFDSLHGQSAVHGYLPLLVERLCHERLRALALTSRPGHTARPQVAVRVYVPDPALMTRRQARRLRYDVGHRVLQLLDELLPGFKPHVAHER